MTHYYDTHNGPRGPGDTTKCKACGSEIKAQYDQREGYYFPSCPNGNPTSDVRAILLALGISDHARPYSLHEIVNKEIIPKIKELRR